MHVILWCLKTCVSQVKGYACYSLVFEDRTIDNITIE